MGVNMISQVNQSLQLSAKNFSGDQKVEVWTETLQSADLLAAAPEEYLAGDEESPIPYYRISNFGIVKDMTSGLRRSLSSISTRRSGIGTRPTSSRKCGESLVPPVARENEAG